MNTKFGYLYRDASNYKKFHDVVIAGSLNSRTLETCLKDGSFFIPSEVGLPDLQDLPFTSEDHIWHEISFITPTTSPTTTDITAEDLARKFESAQKNDWNEYDVFSRKGLI